MWVKLDTETIKTITIFGEPGIVRITHFYKKDAETKKVMLRGYLELGDDKLDYIMPFEMSEFNV